MRRPLFLELNTRCWLRELSARRGKHVSLGTVPEEEFEQWRKLGVTHLWLMGVWTTGPRSRARYFEQAGTRAQLDRLLPGWRDEDVPGSPYAIAEYRVPDALGGEQGLRTFRETLHRHDIQLVLDFVPNHVGLDHPWVQERPELFVQSRAGNAEAFRQETVSGPHWLAYGKDPYFPAWVDAAQLDFRRAETRATVLQELHSVSERCDGVRCDMAMLLLMDVFARTWAGSPPVEMPAAGEFWAEAIAAVKRPGFTFVAEAYWDLEEKLQALGLDFTYDKRVTDFIVERRHSELQAHLLSKSQDFLRRSVHFLENHDEERIASRLSLPEQRAAALLVAALPGMCLLHERQTAGARIRVPVQWSRRPDEPVNADVMAWYEQLLRVLPQSSVGRGEFWSLRPHAASPEARTIENVFVILWKLPGAGAGFDLAVANLSGDSASIQIALPESVPPVSTWLLADRLGDAASIRKAKLAAGKFLLLETPPHSAQLLHFRPGD